jgi:hypothetical protein
LGSNALVICHSTGCEMSAQDGAIQNREALIPKNHPAYPAPLLKLHAGQATWPFSTVVLPPLDQGTLALRLISSVDALWMAA